MKPDAKLYEVAKKEGRICHHCGWIVTRRFWNKNKSNLCAGCYDALKGVNTSRGTYPASDEPRDRTGEM